MSARYEPCLLSPGSSPPPRRHHAFRALLSRVYYQHRAIVFCHPRIHSPIPEQETISHNHTHPSYSPFISLAARALILTDICYIVLRTSSHLYSVPPLQSLYHPAPPIPRPRNLSL
ncbi:hypothetical protein K466DRAFT_68460 [Polyporus arcularius HHB13444]|uniref:Uncharacterized protein n=1 Tax=Polyporus arcularius HHB13444 TaxID=1314778 RepID=A0A5C3PJZ0_9APHY|nr:hypothetical protein K466DRAFT_68460 [Polyporus arcularius HHB13444]